MDEILRVEKLNLRKGNKYIIKDFNVSIERHMISVVLGVNGAGKSSLAYVLMGLSGYSPDGGKIYFDGKDITKLSITKRARMGMTLAWQVPANFEGLTVRDYLMLGMKNKSIFAVKDALNRVAMDPILYMNRVVDKSLSGGERKRIELASVYAMHPEFVILDEPDSGIDIISLVSIKGLIKGLKDNGSTVLLITHRNDVADIADKAFLMCSGTIIKEGLPEEISSFFAGECDNCNHRGAPESSLVKGKEM